MQKSFKFDQAFMNKIEKNVKLHFCLEDYHYDILNM